MNENQPRSYCSLSCGGKRVTPKKKIKNKKKAYLRARVPLYCYCCCFIPAASVVTWGLSYCLKNTENSVDGWRRGKKERKGKETIKKEEEEEEKVSHKRKEKNSLSVHLLSR